MPWIKVKRDNGIYVYKKGADGKPEGEALNKAPMSEERANKYLAALHMHADQKQGKGNPTSFDDYAAGDPDLPSTWKLQIQDRKHVGLALAALGSDKNAPHGNAVKLSPEERKQALSRIRARIPKVANDEEDKKTLLAELNKHGSKAMFDIPFSSGDSESYEHETSSGIIPIAHGADWSTKLDPDDPRVAYGNLAGNKTYACANCQWFLPRSASCQMVEGDIVATGYCNLWLREPSPEEKTQAEAESVIEALSSLTRANGVQPGVRETILQAVKSVLQTGSKILNGRAAPDFSSGFKTFGPDNNYWVAFFSNNAQDRDSEWFAEKAHDQYIARLDRKEVQMPFLDYWHIHAPHGQAFFVDRVGHMVMAVGEFFSDPFSQAMKEHYQHASNDTYGVSFGYLYPLSERRDGVYYDYTAFEISPLPSEVASNPYGGFAVLEEKSMPITEEKRKQLETRLGPELAARLLDIAGQKSADLDKITSDFKQRGDPLDGRIGALEKQLASIADVLSTLALKQGKMMDEEDEEEEGGEEDKKKKKAEQEAEAKKKETARDGYLQTLGKNQETIAAQLKQMQTFLAQQFGTIESAQGAASTAVPPNDPALAALRAKMVGQGNLGMAPSLNPSETEPDYMALVFGMGAAQGGQ